MRNGGKELCFSLRDTFHSGRERGQARMRERERGRERRLHFLFPGETTPLSTSRDAIRQNTASLSPDQVDTYMFQGNNVWRKLIWRKYAWKYSMRHHIFMLKSLYIDNFRVKFRYCNLAYFQDIWQLVSLEHVSPQTRWSSKTPCTGAATLWWCLVWKRKGKLWPKTTHTH